MGLTQPMHVWHAMHGMLFPLRRPPAPKQSLESKARVPPKVTVRVPKDLFNAATYSGNHHLVQRHALLQEPGAIEASNAGGSPRPGLRLGPLTGVDALQRVGIRPRVPVQRNPVKRKVFTEEYHFDVDSTDSFPPR